MISFTKIKHGNELLDLLNQSNNYLTVDTLENSLHLSRRGIFYLLHRINEELEEVNLDPVLNLHNIGYFLTPETKKSLDEKFSQDSNKNYSALSKEKRQTLITWYLINNTTVSINDVVSMFSVSNHTAISDLNNIKRLLLQRGLKLKQTANGKQVFGPEVTIRGWVLEQLNDAQSLIYGFIQPDPASIDFIQDKLHQLEQNSKNYFSDDAIMMMSEFILWLINRLKHKTNILTSLPNSYKSSRNYDTKWAYSLLTHFNINNLFESVFLAQIVNATQFYQVNKSDELINRIQPITRNVIDRFNALSGSDIPAYVLENSLTTHLVSTYYRATFGIKYTHPDLKTIINNYHELFVFTQMAIRPFESFANCHLSDDEIALIAVYFGGQLRNKAEVTEIRPDILLVCSSGIGTSVLLRNQLTSLYPQINFSQPLSVFQFKNYNLQDVKLIISTIDLPTSSKINVIRVSPILTDDNIKHIDNFIGFEQQKNSTSNTLNVDTILDVINDFVRIENIEGLKNALSNYLQSLNTSNKKIIETEEQKNTLANLITKNHITCLQNPMSWHKALITAFKPLSDEHIVAPEYVDKIISLTKENGPYMNLGNGVFLAHATPNDGVHDLGLSLLISKYPIKIETNGHPENDVTIIIGLAPIDQESHLGALAQLLQKLQNYEWLNQLKQVNSVSQAKHLFDN
ncbi:BglG family transcription antiterminator [Paucilactobacillus kaifaensis]|uniref:BglG family transcription antiterminator n=1 Tax=Paucilactobacillus kaifaensis TaxID=2559921 RepID=UPI0010F5E495|nr:PTS sugar transporter subunit IIA [Paucilactobacillus kaifaensis]